MEKEKILALCNAIAKGNLMETLEIKFVDVGEDFLAARIKPKELIQKNQ
jgi:hypothetical protein